MARMLQVSGPSRRPVHWCMGALIIVLCAAAGLACAGVARGNPSGSAAVASTTTTGSTYWVDVCAGGNQASVLTPVTEGATANAKMTTSCGSASTNTLRVTITNSGTTVATTTVGSGTTAMTTTSTTYKTTAAAGEQAGWVVYAPQGESFVGLQDSGATYNSPSTQNAFGPGSAWSEGFAWLSGATWAAGPASGEDVEDCFNGGTSCGTGGVATSTGEQYVFFPAVTAEDWGLSCNWIPSATTACNNDGATASVTGLALQIKDPQATATITPVAGQALNAEEGHWVSGNAANGTTGSWTVSDPGGICQVGAYLSAEWAQDGSFVGQQEDAVSNATAPFDSNDSDYNATTCTGPASVSISPATKSLSTGAWDVDGTAANPAQYAVDGSTTSLNGTLYIDNNTPTVNFSGAASGAWTRGATTVTVNGSDGSEPQGQNSGIASITCTDAANGSWTNGTPTAQGAYNTTQSQQVTVSKDGISKLFCTATNGVGTTSADDSFTFKIDSQKPKLYMTKLALAPHILRTPPTITASGSEQQKLSGVQAQCFAHNTTTGDRLSTKAAAKASLTLTSGGHWTVTCRASTGAGVSTAHIDKVVLAKQKMPGKLELVFPPPTYRHFTRAIYKGLPVGAKWTFTLAKHGRKVTRSAVAKPALKRLFAWLASQRYGSGVRLTFKLTRPGYRAEGVIITFHDGGEPTYAAL